MLFLNYKVILQIFLGIVVSVFVFYLVGTSFQDKSQLLVSKEKHYRNCSSVSQFEQKYLQSIQAKVYAQTLISKQKPIAIIPSDIELENVCLICIYRFDSVRSFITSLFGVNTFPIECYRDPQIKKPKWLTEGSIYVKYNGTYSTVMYYDTAIQVELAMNRLYPEV